MIGVFFYIVLFKLLPSVLKSTQIKQRDIMLIGALVSGYISILITNFFGFSVVIINIYMFLIPAFVLIIAEYIKPAWDTASPKEIKAPVGPPKILIISILAVVALFLIYKLLVFWLADQAYALGYNMDRANQYQLAYKSLHDAVSQRGDEPTFWDELSINDAVIAASLIYQKQPQQASSIASEAIAVSNKVVTEHPYDVVFWKTRVRVFYTLGQVDTAYFQQALSAILQASKLAPTDAKISYNLGLLYGQTGQYSKATQTLENTIALKPDYKDAYYALGIFYHQRAINSKGVVVNADLEQKAVSELHYILAHLAPNDPSSLQALKSWKEK